MENSGYEELRLIASRVAGEVAGFLRDHMGSIEDLRVERVRVEDESMRIDIEAERMVVELLSSEGFQGVVVGEELGRIELGKDGYIAVVDPLDGSKNYAAQIPWAAVSIAIAPRAQPYLERVVAGAVAPVTPWYPVYSFAKNSGVYEGSSKIEPLREKPLSRIVLAYIEKPEQAEPLLSYLRLTGGRRAVRALGSASLEIIWASLGRVELFMDVRGKLRVVDVAAALGIARETGARIYVENPDAILSEGSSRAGSIIVTQFGYAWNTISGILFKKQ